MGNDVGYVFPDYFIQRKLIYSMNKYRPNLSSQPKLLLSGYKLRALRFRAIAVKFYL